MATRAEYKAQGYTDQQINDAVAKKSATVQQSAGPNAPISAQPVTNPNLVPLTSAPVAPVSPDIAPAMREGTAANPVAQAPVAQVPVETPQAVAQPVPVAPISPDIAPSERPGTATVAEAPVTAPKVAAVAKKTAAPKVAADQTVNYDSSVGRDQEILANLSEGYKNAPELFRDQNSFKDSYGYATADEGKKRMLDAFWQAKQPKTSDQFLSYLIAGDKVWNADVKASNEFLNAQSRYDLSSQYKGASADTLYNAMVSGKLSPESNGYKDLLKINGVETPEMVEAKRKFETKRKIDNINRSSEIASGSASGKGYSDTPNSLETISADVANSKGMDYAEEFKKSIVDNPELKQLSTELSATNTEVADLERKKKETMDNIAKQYPGITTGSAMLLEAQQNKAINSRLDQLYDKSAIQKANLDYNTNLALKTFDYKKEQFQEQQKAAIAERQAATQFAQQKELAQFQSDLSITADQKKFEQQLAQKAAIAKDPVLATQDVLDQYRKLGVLAQRSDAEIVADVQAQVKAGKPLGSVLSDLNRAFQSKDEYKNAIAKQFPSQGTDWEIQSVTQDGITRSVERNKKTGEMRELGTGTTGTSAPSPTDYGLPSGSFTDLSSTLKRTGNNVGKDTNNPGNIMAESPKGVEYAKSLGAIGSYTSPNGRTYAVFPDMETGKNATIADLKAKLSGGSSWVTPETTLGQFATGWTVGPKAGYNSSAANSYAKISGFSPSTRIKDIPLETLANAIIRHEGVDPNKSADIGTAVKATVPAFAQQFLGAVQRGEFTTIGEGTAAAPKSYTATQQAVLSDFLKNPKDALAKKEMKSQGLSQSDADYFSANKPKTTELSDDQRVIFNSQLSGFRQNQVVKDYEQQIGQVSNITASLGANSGPGDIAAVFQFMKALDPSSVVREGEFALAARSSGLVGSFQNTLTKLENGEMLNAEQKKQFAQLAKEYLKNKSAQYDRLYDDMKRVTELSGVPADYLPKRASEDVKNAFGSKNVASMSSQTYQNLVSKYGQTKADAYVKAKGFTVNR